MVASYLPHTPKIVLVFEDRRQKNDYKRVEKFVYNSRKSDYNPVKTEYKPETNRRQTGDKIQNTEDKPETL